MFSVGGIISEGCASLERLACGGFAEGGGDVPFTPPGFFFFKRYLINELLHSSYIAQRLPLE